MGKRHRQNRKVEKQLAKVIALHPRLKQTELGELRPDVSKAEARRRFIRKHAFLLGRLMTPQEREMAMLQILDMAHQRSIAQIQAEEDARVFKMLDDLVAEAK